MKIFITGIAGFLGGHLAEQLLKEGHEVYGNDSMVCGDADNVPSTLGKYVKWFPADCCDYDRMSHLLSNIKPDVVVHCAATAHEGFSPFSPHMITRNVLDASVSTFSAAIASGVKRIVFMSTMARYGKGYQDALGWRGAPFTEEHKPNPCDPYGIAKVAAEEILKNLCEFHGVKWSIMVPHNIIGTRQKYDDPYRNVVSIFMNRMLQGKPAVVYGDGEQTRCFSPIGDVLPSIIKAVHGEADGEVINIGPDSDDNKMTINELAERIGNLTGHNSKPDYYPERGCDAKHATCLSHKAREVLGFEATHDVNQCFKEMVDDIKVRGAKPFSYFMPIEIDSEKTPRTWKERLL
jgi:UDP-glucose 4-epimerase